MTYSLFYYYDCGLILHWDYVWWLFLSWTVKLVTSFSVWNVGPVVVKSPKWFPLNRSNMEEKKKSHPLHVAISGLLTFNFVPFADSFGICAGVIGHYYEADSSRLAQAVRRCSAFAVRWLHWPDWIWYMRKKIKLEWFHWGLILTFNTN